MAQGILLKVDGMGCQACINAVEKAIKSVDHAASASIDLATGRVDIAASGFEAGVFASAITAAGYDATLA